MHAKILIGLLAAGLALAGCIDLDDEPDESTADPDGTNGQGGGQGTDGDDDNDDGTGGQGQGQEQGQGQHQVVSQNQTVIVVVGPTPTSPGEVPPPPPPASPTPPAQTTAPPITAPPADDDDDPEPRVWPSEGSHAAFDVVWVRAWSDGARNETRAEASWTFTNGDWRGTCVATWTATSGDGTQTTGTSTRTYTIEDPPHWPLFNTRQTPQVSGPIDAWFLRGCEIASEHVAYAGEAWTAWNGRELRVDTAREPNGAPATTDFHTEWDDHAGLVVRWSLDQVGEGIRGELRSTDAPLAYR